MVSARYLIVRRLARRRIPARPRRQRGTIAIVTTLVLAVLFGFFGLALDLARIYNRKVEMQNVADVIALAAAGELNGTSDGMTKALAQAAARLPVLGTTGGMTFQYSTRAMEWTDAAIKFSSSLATDAHWVDATAATASPGQIRYVRVDTSHLNAEYGEVATMFMQILSTSASVINVSARATAGPSSVKAVPLALCPLQTEPAKNRSGELVEYGFRRGMSYDLMNLPVPGSSFVIHPLFAPGTNGVLPSTDMARVRPFVCTGTMAMPRVTGGTITVENPFPIGALFTQLNSRFDVAGAPCNQYTAPPDANIRAYTFNNNNVTPYNGSVSWMTAAPSGQAAAPAIYADPDSAPIGTTGPMYGPLWSYAKAAKYAASPDAAGGYSTFATSDWTTLYTPGQPAANNTYPATAPVTTPYASTSGAAFFLAPSTAHKGVRGRRVLNIPLLACPVAGNTANVIAIGKFFMTVPATATNLWAEFAGLAPAAAVGGQVELHP